MKSTSIYFTHILAVLITLSTMSVFSQITNNPISKSSGFSLEFAPKQIITQNLKPDNPKNIKGSIGYGNNIWTNKLYTINTDAPFETTVIADITSQSTSGDFYPDEYEYFYILDINDNFLRKTDVANGETVGSVFIEMPLAEGIWTVLTIHKTTGVFYGVATNGTQSNVYEINKTTGATTLYLSTGLPAVISGTFDGEGLMWLFEIANDSIYKLDIDSQNIQLVGAAGFDGDSPQGMGYDALEDNVYLAAYEKNVGPQLRLLNPLTGVASYICNLPGETTAFGFPGGTVPIQHSIQIPTGWSSISSFVNPEDTDMANILSEIIDDFILMENINGDLYWPQQGITTLQNWDASHGYIINMSEPATLTITGTPIENLTLNFDAGWNILPIVVPEEYPVDVLFENIDGFVMAKEIVGTKIYWPEHDINTIGDLIPGKAYSIYSTQNISVAFE